MDGFATVARGLESLAAQELLRLGAEAVEPGFCGVSFRCQGLAQLYRINLWSRLPFRILVHLASFPCRDAGGLYQGIQAVDWQAYLTPAQTLAVKATGKTRQLNHTHFTALQVKNAIVDQQQRQLGERSHVDPKTPDVLVNLHLSENRAVVSLDSSGSSLHRRGYRPAMGAAPLKESLAAALIQLTDWQPDLPFLDPMCGSGTLPIEAGLLALNIAPGLFRDTFGFQTWPDFEPALWQQLVDEAQQAQTSQLAAPIVGCDRNPDILQQAHTNARNCGVDQHIRLVSTDLATIDAPADSGILLCNPPYGERIGNPAALGALYKQLGDRLKQQFKGWTAYILSGNPALTKCIGLRSAQRWPIYNGALPCQLLKYELY
jgi:putative N6-adenine-specific DNA methylase